MAKQSNKDSCMGYEHGWTSEDKECKDCKKNSLGRYTKCMQAVKKSLKENFSTEEEIEKWKKERTKNVDIQ